MFWGLSRPVRPLQYTLAEFVEEYGGTVEDPPQQWLDAATGDAPQQDEIPTRYGTVAGLADDPARGPVYLVRLDNGMRLWAPKLVVERNAPRAQPPPRMVTQTLAVKCPAGVAVGQVLAVPVNGGFVEVEVPEGTQAGDMIRFQAQLPETLFMPTQGVSAPVLPTADQAPQELDRAAAYLEGMLAKWEGARGGVSPAELARVSQVCNDLAMVYREQVGGARTCRLLCVCTWRVSHARGHRAECASLSVDPAVRACDGAAGEV